MIDKPGLYDIADADYHADPVVGPSLSSSIVKLLDQQTPLHAWQAHPRLNPQFVEKRSKQFDIGSACHELVLRGDSARFAVINALDYRTKHAQELREDAYENRQIPILVDQAASATRMETKVRQFLIESEQLVGVFAPGHGEPEKTLVWREDIVSDAIGVATVWCRAKLDWLPTVTNSHFFWDFKSTDGSAEPESWLRRCCFPLGFDLQAAFYLRGIRAVLGYDDAQFGFIVAEQNEPHACSAIGLPPAVIAAADERVERAIMLWARCLATKRWPGYPSTIWWGAETPPWLRARAESAGIIDKLAATGVGI